MTAEFNKNVLSVLNAELNADFDLEPFEHLARYDARQGWIEMLLRSSVRQTVTVADLDLRVEFGEGELLRTEISAKFTPAQIDRELEDGRDADRGALDRPRRRLRGHPRSRSERSASQRRPTGVTLGGLSGRARVAPPGVGCAAADALDDVERRGRGAAERGAEERVRPERGGGEEDLLVGACVARLDDHAAGRPRSRARRRPGTLRTRQRRRPSVKPLRSVSGVGIPIAAPDLRPEHRVPGCVRRRAACRPRR